MIPRLRARWRRPMTLKQRLAELDRRAAQYDARLRVTFTRPHRGPSRD